MNEQEQSNSEHKTNQSQDLSNVLPQKVTESWEEYRARTLVPGYQSSLVLNDEDDTPLTLQEHLQLIFNNAEEASPAKELGELVVEALKAVISIPKEISDLTYVVERLAGGQDKLTEEIARNNDLQCETLLTVKAILEEQPPPLKPMPVGRQSITSRTEASPGIKRLRKSLKEGG